jgi:hypothetical protein
MTTWPAIMKPTVVTAPGARDQDYRGRDIERPEETPGPRPPRRPARSERDGAPSRATSTATRSANVPTTNEIAAASTGPPTAPRISALTANCTGTAVPAAKASNTRRHEQQ